VVFDGVGPGGRVGDQQGVSAVRVPGESDVLVQRSAAGRGRGLVDLGKVERAADLGGLGADAGGDARAVLDLVEAGRLGGLDVARAVQETAERQARHEDGAVVAAELVHAVLVGEVERVASALVRELQHARVELDDGPGELYVVWVS